jgi:hypothetical protein
VADRSDDNCVAFEVEHDTLVADAQPRPRAPLESLNVALSSLRESCELAVEPSAHIDRKLEPLAGGCCRESDLHFADIAYCNIQVKAFIVDCNNAGRR